MGASAVVSASLTFDKDDEPALLGASKSGNIVVYGRAVHWSASGYLKGLSWRYKATATDTATGNKGSASGLKSGQGAVEHATKNLFQVLIAKGIIPPPPAGVVASGADAPVDVTVMPTIVDAVMEDVEDGSKTNEIDLEYAETSHDIDEQTLMEGAVAVLAAAEDDTMTSEESVDPPVMLRGIFSKEGNTVVYGRTIHYKGQGYLKGLSWRYKATARDVISGITGSVSGFKSGEGAVKEAVTRCFQEMAARGVFPPKA
jgi:hypothetical protein